MLMYAGKHNKKPKIIEDDILEYELYILNSNYLINIKKGLIIKSKTREIIRLWGKRNKHIYGQ